MADELERSVELLERLLGDPQLRRRSRNDAATVLTEAGLPELAAGLGRGGRALMTLEMRESRSSLAGVMVGGAPRGGGPGPLAEEARPPPRGHTTRAMPPIPSCSPPTRPRQNRCTTRRRRRSPPSRTSSHRPPT